MDREGQISVIVPVFQVEAYLARCVESILNQSYQNLEIILVDDGSKDGSGKICDEFQTRDARVRVIHKENGGLSSARNAGLDAARGEYLAFVDSDDWIEPDCYETMLNQMKHWGAMLACAGRYDVDGATGEKTPGLCPEQEGCIPAEEMVGKIFLWDGCDSSACDKLYHHSLFQHFRYPEGMVCEDVPVTYRIVLQAGQVALCNRRVYNYYHRPDSITTGKTITEKTFHFSNHTAEIYPYIREKHPAIANQARYLRVLSLAHILLLLEQAETPVREKFQEQYRHARRELGKHIGFILTSGYFTPRERATEVLLVLGLYRRLRPVFHRT